MKKFTLMLLVAIGSSLASNAQCVPNKPGLPVAKQYIVPDSATGLEPACVGKPYEQIVYIKTFKDSNVTINLFGTNIASKFVIDSFIINLSPTAMGLPSYLSVESVPAAKAPTAKHNFPHLRIAPVLGDSLACLKIFGNVPSTATVGVNPLSIEFIGFADGYIPATAPLPLVNDTTLTTNITAYKINVQAAANCTQGVADYLADTKDIFVAPNPANDKIAIGLNASKAGKYNVQILSMTGALLAAKEMNAQAGLNQTTFDIGSFASGLYIYKITNGQNYISGKFTKE